MSGLFQDDADSVVFRVSDAHRILEQRNEWVRQIAALQEKVDVADRKLQAAELLFDRKFIPDAEKPAAPDQRSEAGGPETLSDAALRIVREAGRRMANDEVRSELAKIGHLKERMVANPNYYYTVMKRHADRGSLIKHPDGSYEYPRQS